MISIRLSYPIASIFNDYTQKYNQIMLFAVKLVKIYHVFGLFYPF